MPTFTYIARSATGERVSGALESANEQAALGELAAKGLAPLRLSTVGSANRRGGGGRVSTRRLASAYQQLGDLLRAGVPLLRALRLLGRSKSNPRLAKVMSDVADQVEDGQRFGDALATHPECFPVIQVAMVRAGERGGFLDQVLVRLGAFLNHQADLRAKVLGNLIYPFVLLGVGALIVLAALTFFVPRFREYYEGMSVPLPTRIVLGSSDLVTRHGLWLLLGAVALVAAAIWAWRRPDVRRWLAIAQVRLPRIGPLIRGFAVARFCRILGTLLGNGIPMLQAMKISRDAAGHPLMEEAIDAASESVRSGEPLAPPLARSGFFEEDVIEMIAVGESANNLDDVLVTIAETIERRNERVLTILLRLMEPLLLMMLAGVVVFIFIALVVPLLSMSASL